MTLGLAVVLAGLAGAAFLLIWQRVVPAPWDALAALGLAIAALGPWTLGHEGWPAAYGGGAAVMLALVVQNLYNYVTAAADAKVREVVRTAPRRVPGL